MSSSLSPNISLDAVPLAHPPNGTTSDFIHPVTLSREIVAVGIVSSTLAAIFLCVKLYSTLKITRSAGYDDIACLCALVFSLAYFALIVDTRNHARHTWDTPISFITPSHIKILFAETMILAVGFLCAKLSILLLLQRLFALSKRSRYCVYICMLWTSIISISAIIVDAALCAPRSGESFRDSQIIHRCQRQKTWSVVQGCLNVLLDFCILYIPIPIIWKLQLDRKKKIGVIAIFLTGLLACVASLLNLAIKGEFLAGSDITWNSYRVDILNIVELNTAIMVACMPACASCFRFISTKANGLRSAPPKEHIGSRAILRDANPISIKRNHHYWELRDASTTGKTDGPPPLTRQVTNLQQWAIDLPSGVHQN